MLMQLVVIPKWMWWVCLAQCRSECANSLRLCLSLPAGHKGQQEWQNQAKQPLGRSSLAHSILCRASKTLVKCMAEWPVQDSTEFAGMCICMKIDRRSERCVFSGCRLIPQSFFLNEPETLTSFHSSLFSSQCDLQQWTGQNNAL